MNIDCQFLRKINIYHQYLSRKNQILFLEFYSKKKRSDNELEKPIKKL